MKLKEIIKQILTISENARNSDTELLIEYCGYLGIELTETQKEQFRKYKIGNDSPRRCRQNLQVEYPELRASEEVIKGRKHKEVEFIQKYGSNSAYLPPLEHYLNNITIKK